MNIERPKIECSDKPVEVKTQPSLERDLDDVLKAELKDITNSDDEYDLNEQLDLLLKEGNSERLSEDDMLSPEDLYPKGKYNLPELEIPKQTYLADSETKNITNNDDTDGTKKIKCNNEHLEGKEHPKTGVPFERKTVVVKGEEVEVVVPKFDSVFDAQLPEDKYEASDDEHIEICNAQLKDAIEQDDELRSQFDDEQIEQIENGDTPDGYTWHHDAEAGKLQLVDTETHQKTGHTGGRNIWGGGTSNR